MLIKTINFKSKRNYLNLNLKEKALEKWKSKSRMSSRVETY